MTDFLFYSPFMFGLLPFFALLYVRNFKELNRVALVSAVALLCVLIWAKARPSPGHHMSLDVVAIGLGITFAIGVITGPIGYVIKWFILRKKAKAPSQ